MVTYGSYDYGGFLDECMDSAKLYELQNALESGQTSGNVNDKFGLYSTNSGVWVTDRETKSKSKVPLGRHGTPKFLSELEHKIMRVEDYEEVRDDPLSQFIRDYFYEADEIFNLLEAYADHWNGCGRPSAIETVEYGEFSTDKVLVKAGNDDIIFIKCDNVAFNLTEYEGDFKDMIDRTMKEYYTHGMEYEDYCRFFEECGA